MGIDFRRQNLTFNFGPRTERVKQITVTVDPLLTEYHIINIGGILSVNMIVHKKCYFIETHTNI